MQPTLKYVRVFEAISPEYKYEKKKCACTSTYGQFRTYQLLCHFRAHHFTVKTENYYDDSDYF